MEVSQATQFQIYANEYIRAFLNPSNRGAEFDKLERKFCDSLERFISNETTSQLFEIQKAEAWEESLIKRWRNLHTDGLVDFRTRVEATKFIFHGKMWFLPSNYDEGCRVVYGELTFLESDRTCSEYAVYWGVDEASLYPRHLDRWRGHEQFIQRLIEGGIQEEDFFFMAKGNFTGVGR